MKKIIIQKSERFRIYFINLIPALFLLISFNSFPQGHPPWESPLKSAWSNDGITFSNVVIFQDSSGVPSIINWKGDTLVCVFQWFRQPMNSLTWDKVAVKFSYDNGLTWTQPQPIILNGIPSSFQRPFDPSIAKINNDSLRVYFSSSDGIPMGGMDSTINTYSASSTDGINFTFEMNPRFDHPTNRVIDPSVIYFNGTWQYAAPIGAPQDGAFHCTSSDGINFIQHADYLSDPMHNWTGNFMAVDSNELWFYGCGQNIWYNSTSDGLTWQGYVVTNIIGGDPAVVRISPSSYFMVYTGQPYSTSINETSISDLSIYPNPASDYLILKGSNLQNFDYSIYSITGTIEQTGKIDVKKFILTEKLSKGNHILFLKTDNSSKVFNFQKE